MDDLFRELLRTLSEAREAVGAELELHARAHSVDMTLLRRLRRSSEEFGDQADALISVMQGRDAQTGMMGEARALSVFFRDVQERTAFLLATGQGKG